MIHYKKKTVDGRYRNSHTVIAEVALGRPLNSPEQVHHVDGDRHNNSNANLVICPDMSYHKLLHARTKALDECGNASYMKCPYCKEYDAPKNMYVRPAPQYQAWHRVCAMLYKRVANPKTGPYKYGIMKGVE